MARERRKGGDRDRARQYGKGWAMNDHTLGLRGTRRALLRGTVAAVGVGLTAGVLAACGPAGRGAAPTGGSAPVVLKLYPPQDWYNIGPQWMQFFQPGMDYFETQNPGIRVQVGAPLPGNNGKYVSEIIAGVGPDVFEDFTPAPYLEAHLVLDLSKYLQRDNINPSIWSPGEMHGLGTAGGVYFLPNGIHVNAMGINLSLLDEMGLAYPEPDWGYAEATRLFQAATHDKGGIHHYGVHLQFAGSSLGTNIYVLHNFGAALMDGSGTRCTLDDPRAIEAVRWADQLYWAKVAGGPLDLENVPFIEVGTNSLLPNLRAWANKFQWTYFPVPKYPAGQFSFEAVQFYAVNVATAHPEEAWTLTRFLTAEPWWARYEMKYLLRMPSIDALLQEFVAAVETVAPPAKGKHLDYFVTAADRWGVSPRVFRYADPAARSMIDNAFALAFAQKVDVGTALTRVARQVDALEATSATEAPRVSGTALITQGERNRLRLEGMFSSGGSGRPNRPAGTGP